tara:strand:- start:28013 stop:29392 length:1380 start_codon:yes stop_codon:yes gene_type:complete
MKIFKLIAAVGLAVSVLTGGVNAQMIGGEVSVDGSNDDVRFFGGELNVRGEIDGDIFAITGDGEIDATVHGDVKFFGGDLNLSGIVDGQVQIAGGDVTMSGDFADDVNVAGGDISIDGSVGGQLSAAGGSVQILASVGNGLRLGGGDIVIRQGSEIAGDSRIVAGELHFSGVNHGDVEIEGADITLDGLFEGDIDVTAERVHVLASTQITGELRVRSPMEARIEPGARIGSVDYQFEAFNFGAKHMDDIDVQIDGPWDVIDAPARFIGGAFIGSAFLLGLLALVLAPRGVGSVAAAFRRRPLSSGILGFISFALSPVVFVMLTVLLAITLIGVFLIPVLWGLYLPVLILAFALGGVAVGDLVFSRFSRHEHMGLGLRALSLLVVMAVIFALGAVPGLGVVVGLLVMCVGLGSWILALGRRQPRERFDDRMREPRREPVRERDVDATDGTRSAGETTNEA